MTEKRKLLYWEGSSKKDFKEFPFPYNRTWASRCLWCSWVGSLTRPTLEGVGFGCLRTFRAIYTVRIGDAVHVLHAFQKKSKSGIATPQPDVELIEKRWKAVIARYGASGRS